MVRKEINRDPPLLSICCTTYNMEDCIHEAFESFLMQKTDFSYEIIIHDDASTDRTPEIIQNYSNRYPEISFITLQEENQYRENNVGLGEIYARYLFAPARGTYIAMCDGDDYWTDPFKLQKQVDFLKTHEDCTACFTNATIQNGSTDNTDLYHKNLEEGYIPEKKIILSGGGLYPTSSLVFKKKALFSSNLYQKIDEVAADLVGDTILIYALSTQGKIGYLNQVTSVYRMLDCGLYSSIRNDKSKIAKRQEKQIKGLKKINGYMEKTRQKLLERKISVESLYVIRHGNEIDRFKHLNNLTLKEVIKLLTGLN